MKRLLVLTMVLAMAPFAVANLTIGADGDPVSIGPSDTLLLEIISDGDYAPTFMLVVDNAHGSISGGALTSNSGDWPYNYNYYVPNFAYVVGISPDPWLPPYTATVNGISWTLGYNDNGSNVSGVVFDQIEFRFEGPGDAVIQLWHSPDFGFSWVLDDTLTVHQIPEPITMALLGLGGLFLRRRK
jgi:hypothetical protein